MHMDCFIVAPGLGIDRALMHLLSALAYQHPDVDLGLRLYQRKVERHRLPI